MAFKDLLLLFGKGTEAGNRYALWLANACGATLTAVAPVVKVGLPPGVRAEMPSDILAEIREDAESAARQSLDVFVESAKLAGVAVEPMLFEATTTDTSGEVSRMARYFDATVLQQPHPGSLDTSEFIEAVLFGSGRPVLIVPYIHAAPQLRTVLIAWDEGRLASRAVRDALPLLAMADRVEIVTVNGGAASRHGLRDDLARHLARHSIAVEQMNISRGDMDVANALLSYAADEVADLLVMGGYGHSRLREMVLGGTTRTMLQTMTVPVLMAH
jgi:nucleotide-binding universal stress UspA family protein